MVPFLKVVGNFVGYLVGNPTGVGTKTIKSATKLKLHFGVGESKEVAILAKAAKRPLRPPFRQASQHHSQAAPFPCAF